MVIMWRRSVKKEEMNEADSEKYIFRTIENISL